MKKKGKIILIIIGILLLGVGYFGYKMYKMVMGSEDIIGKQDAVPALTVEIPPITKGTADWPCWRGTKLDGKSETIGIKTDWSKGLQKLWQVDFLCQGNSTASWSAPVVQGNRLVIPGRDEKNDLLFCINTDNGKLIWKGTYPAPAEDSHGPGPRATPCINENKVYSFGRSGDLTCWQLEDGKLAWRKNVKDLSGKEPQWGYSTSPFVYKNKVIIQGGGKALVIAYDKNNGDVLWKSMEGDAGYAAATLMKIENDTMLLIYHGKGLSCMNPETGKELWRVPWETSYGVNATTPIVDNDIVFHTSGYEMGGQALKVNKNSFTVLWKNDVMAAQHSDVILINGYIYGYSGESTQNKGYLKCLELSSGKEMWSTKEVGCGTMAYADGYLICLDLKGNLFLVKPDSGKFQKLGEIKKALDNVGNFAWTMPVIANGKLYVRYLQTLICYNLMP